MTNQNLFSANSLGDYENIVSSHKQKTFVLNFWAEWATQCVEQMNDVFSELAKRHVNMIFINVEAEKLAEVSEEYDISAVPVFVIIQDGKEVARVDGANPSLLTKTVDTWDKRSHLLQSLPTVPDKPKESTKIDLQTRLKNLTSMAKIVLFMKGSPETPKCGFSRQIVELLNDLKVKFMHYDILLDEEVRQGLKEYANWPTYPQLWINGELVGGLDVVREMIESGEMKELLGLKEESLLDDRLKKLINKSKVMIFIKGSPSSPQCGFSRQLISLLDDLGVTYEYFDILQDEEIRQGLKIYSDWPTYPQVYVNGDLIGGLDIVREMIETGEFQDYLQ